MIIIPKKYNLLKLLRVTEMFTADLMAVFNLEDETDSKQFQLLKHAYVNVRYKDTFEADRNTVIALLEKVKLLGEKISRVYHAHLKASCL